MFDIGFTELLVIATIALLVIGPERLPETVRTVSMWIGRLKRSLRETRREIEQQIGADDIRRELHNEEIMRNIEKIRSDVDSLHKDHGPRQTDPSPQTNAEPGAGEPESTVPSAEDSRVERAPESDTSENAHSATRQTSGASDRDKS